MFSLHNSSRFYPAWVSWTTGPPEDLEAAPVSDGRERRGRSARSNAVKRDATTIGAPPNRGVSQEQEGSKVRTCVRTRRHV